MALNRRVRVECETCGWVNEAYDEPWVRNSGVAHTKMLKPGHVLVGDKPLSQGSSAVEPKA